MSCACCFVVAVAASKTKGNGGKKYEGSKKSRKIGMFQALQKQKKYVLAGSTVRLEYYCILNRVITILFSSFLLLFDEQGWCG